MNYLRYAFWLHPDSSSSISGLFPPTFLHEDRSIRARPTASHVCDPVSQRCLAGEPCLEWSVLYYFYIEKREHLWKLKHFRENWACLGLLFKSGAVHSVFQKMEWSSEGGLDWLLCVITRVVFVILHSAVVPLHLAVHLCWMPCAHTFGHQHALYKDFDVLYLIPYIFKHWYYHWQYNYQNELFPVLLLTFTAVLYLYYLNSQPLIWYFPF